MCHAINHANQKEAHALGKNYQNWGEKTINDMKIFLYWLFLHNNYEKEVEALTLHRETTKILAYLTSFDHPSKKCSCNRQTL